MIHSAAARADGVTIGWGDNFLGQANLNGLSNVVAVSGGGTFSLALRSNGTVAVRGDLPPPPASASNVTAIAAGWRHALALRQDGTVISWGDTNTVPAGLSNVVAIAAGDGHSLALLANRSVVAWGETNFQKTVVPPGLTNVVAVSAGKDHCLALQWNGRLVAWGRNEDGQATVPASLTNLVAISAGGFHNLVLRPNGTAAAWGNNLFNQGFAPALTGFRRIAAGGYHNLGLIGEPSPAITLQPRSQHVALGKTAAFVAMSVGQQPITYQWLKNGTNLLNQTNGLFIIPAVQTNDAAVYSVRVANSAGTVTSVDALLTAFPQPPTILAQPQDITRLCGETAQFTVVAEGFLPLSYQWQFENEPIADATNAQLVLSNVTLSQAGGYSVVLTNVAGAVTSVVASLAVTVVPPVITVEPEDTTVICGEDALFHVTATSVNPLSYQWLYEGSPLEGATNENLTLASARVSQAGGYSVIVADQCGVATSVVAVLEVVVEPPIIISPLTASGSQGQPFNYGITALHNPTSFSASQLPLGLSLDPVTGIISGTPLQSGVYSPQISTFNECASHSEILTLTFTSGIPVITSTLSIAGSESTSFTYQITAMPAAQTFGALLLPDGLTLNPLTGLISGSPVFPGTHQVTLLASNKWGVGTAHLTIFITNRVITGLAISDVTYTYSSPYLLGFEFTLQDADGNGIITDPALLSAICMENTHPGTTLVTWPTDEPRLPSATQLVTNLVSESGVFFVRSTGSGGGKVIKTYLVLDFSESIADPFLNGDSNDDGISDAVDYMLSGAHYFVDQQSAGSQVGIYEFHRDDEDPNQVLALTDEQSLLSEALDGIWTNYVNWFYAGSRCWDAVDAAILAMGDPNPDEQRSVIFISDGRDSSSLATVNQVIADARNGGVRVYCIAFGGNPDLATLSQITWATGGRLFDAQSQADLFEEFTEVTKNVQARYSLRWASLRRDATEIAPFFLLSYQGHTAAPPEWTWYYETNTFEVYSTNITYTTNTTVDPPEVEEMIEITTNEFSDISVLWENPEIGAYFATNYAGPVTVGSLRLALDEEVMPTGISLRAGYIPRFIRQLRLHYRPNWPCTPMLNATNVGELLHGWSLTESNDVDGSTWLLLRSPNPQSLATSLAFPGFGPLLTFRFNDIITNAAEAFALIEVDNSIYTNIPAGGQQFVFDAGITNYITDYPALPFGTPVPWLAANGITGNLVLAETADPDGDGVPNWQEYRANTNPQDPSSRFVVRGLSNDEFGRYLITFSTSLNRRYRVETSGDLVNWELVQDGIIGTGLEITILDQRYIPWINQVFYRVVVY